ncbi:hypothetical protein SARC_05283 [Sphaeroforma arctica JP610]|uniref:1-alkyl-2-acetylglycerophosphocholine esterase n=1 Tax=Sphaeroforma arctica JP610 TaxID=667725 RepID=A0A0L0G2K6_9EUKA|nr:hypothetical protein SARC_05283 [Sphaeroforma arctica JP610]KNC82433.1 hypothetical protein SARC_05283 [Sphaeroforma arctica JP610]|eukprot:XP_014156335.1 hypothetical protein SARC_05283 [Sphaeroforma arctica JP610]
MMHSLVAFLHIVASALVVLGVAVDDNMSDRVAENISEPSTVNACENTTIYKLPENYSERGPWTVGARNIELAGYNTEVWYPALWGSEAGKDKHVYDIRQWIPENMADDIPDDIVVEQVCDCYIGLPVDSEHGPYPVMVFIHGTAGFRTQSLTIVNHWASRGFIVVAADHPGLYLGSLLSFQLQRDVPGDVDAMINALKANVSDIAFLEGKMDLSRIAVSGHSAGGFSLNDMGEIEGVLVLIPMAADGTNGTDFPGSSLILGAVDDAIVAYDRQAEGYEVTPPSKRLVGIANAGHLAFSDLCVIGADDGGIVEIAFSVGLPIPDVLLNQFARLGTDGCDPGQLAPQKGWDIVNYASSAVMEEALMCDLKAVEALRNITDTFEDVSEYREDLIIVDLVDGSTPQDAATTEDLIV